MDRLLERLGGVLFGLAVTMALCAGTVSAHSGEDHGTEGGGWSLPAVIAVATIIIAARLIYRSARRRTL